MAKKEKLTSAQAQTMTLEEAKAYRASLYKPQPKILTEDQRREAFRVWWTGFKKKYGFGPRSKTMEKALWLHLKSIGMDNPEDFEKGLSNFGLKKV